MLSTIVLSLLAIYLTILVGCQLVGMYVGYNLFKGITAKNMDIQ